MLESFGVIIYILFTINECVEFLTALTSSADCCVPGWLLMFIIYTYNDHL